jgi:hypothetical protein
MCRDCIEWAANTRVQRRAAWRGLRAVPGAVTRETVRCNAQLDDVLTSSPCLSREILYPFLEVAHELRLAPENGHGDLLLETIIRCARAPRAKAADNSIKLGFQSRGTAELAANRATDPVVNVVVQEGLVVVPGFWYIRVMVSEAVESINEKRQLGLCRRCHILREAVEGIAHRDVSVLVRDKKGLVVTIVSETTRSLKHGRQLGESSLPFGHLDLIEVGCNHLAMLGRSSALAHQCLLPMSGGQSSEAPQPVERVRGRWAVAASR